MSGLIEQVKKLEATSVTKVCACLRLIIVKYLNTFLVFQIFFDMFILNTLKIIFLSHKKNYIIQKTTCKLYFEYF